jgi:hypothetical protein
LAGRQNVEDQHEKRMKASTGEDDQSVSDDYDDDDDEEE